MKVVIIINTDSDLPSILTKEDNVNVAESFSSFGEADAYIEAEWDSTWGETKTVDIE